MMHVSTYLDGAGSTSTRRTIGENSLLGRISKQIRGRHQRPIRQTPARKRAVFALYAMHATMGLPPDAYERRIHVEAAECRLVHRTLEFGAERRPPRSARIPRHPRSLGLAATSHPRTRALTASSSRVPADGDAAPARNFACRPSSFSPLNARAVKEIPSSEFRRVPDIVCAGVADS